KYYMHTGYREGQGGVVYPSLGSIASQEIGKSDSLMPNYVAIGARSYGSGFLGPKHQPLLVTNASRGVEDLKAIVSDAQLSNRVGLGGWDTHQDNWTRVKNLSGQVDVAMSSLVLDLKERGLLDSTLVIWMGEFGRTPHINQRGAKPGRDHYPRAWSLAMFGGGL